MQAQKYTSSIHGNTHFSTVDKRDVVVSLSHLKKKIYLFKEYAMPRVSKSNLLTPRQWRWRPLAKPISVHLGKHRLVSGLVCSVQFNLPAPPPLIDSTHFSWLLLIHRAPSGITILLKCRQMLILLRLVFLMKGCSCLNFIFYFDFLIAHCYCIVRGKFSSDFVVNKNVRVTAYYCVSIPYIRYAYCILFLSAKVINTYDKMQGLALNCQKIFKFNLSQRFQLSGVLTTYFGLSR